MVKVHKTWKWFNPKTKDTQYIEKVKKHSSVNIMMKTLDDYELPDIWDTKVYGVKFKTKL